MKEYNNDTCNENLENVFIDIPIRLRHLKRPSSNQKNALKNELLWI